MSREFVALISAPDVFSGILIFIAVCALAIIVLLIALLKKTADRNFENQAQLVKLEEIVRMSQTSATRLFDSVRRDFLTVTSDLKSTQDTHFTNFLGIINGNADTQNKTTARLQEALLSQLQLQTQTQDRRLESLTSGISTNINEMRKTVTEQLQAIRNANDKALAGMRETVDEKLQATLNTRITESFKTVEDQLLAVHKGLGEMREMAQNVDALRRVLTNVKTRGTFGEVQLGMILEQILTPGQYAANVATRPNSNERVEFAIRLPGADDSTHVWLPIDAKFPMEDYERLLCASEAADAQLQETSLKAIYSRILSEAKKIHDKYVEVPYTTEFAVMYLPIEGLWSEVIKIPGLIERVQRQYHITIAGPTVLAALLNSLQMGFRTLAIEQKSAEVWKLLGEVKMEFSRFNDVVDALEKKLETMKSAVGSVRTRTNAMSRKLKSVESADVVLTQEPSLSDDKDS